MPAMTSTTTVNPQVDQSLEVAVHKLKLQWIMSNDDKERSRISEEIRRLLAPPTQK